MTLFRSLPSGALTALAAILALVAGCSNLPSVNPLNWWSGKAGPKMAELQEFKQTAPLRPLWQSAVGASGEAVLFPALAAGHVFAADQAGSVTRIDAESGRVAWRASAGRKLTGGVGADASLVVVGTGEGEVVAMEAADGNVRWRARVSSEVLAAPEVAGDLVVVRSADNRIFGLDSRDGKRRWVYQRAAQSLAIRTPAGLVVSRGNAYAGFPGGKLVSVSLGNGGLRWEATVAVPRGATELERVADVVGLPWISERDACAVAFQGRVACFDLASGNAHWGRELSSVSGIGADGRHLYVSDDRGNVHALDRNSGTSVWKQDRLAYRNPGVPLALGAEVVVG
ncbi:MAG: outer membrane protein assembly factor BamB, partial [Betaproteobacteria bacterium]|nr:outer membrane protein assembly factor BamB [Betaproteobacteria bacterium]